MKRRPYIAFVPVILTALVAAAANGASEHRMDLTLTGIQPSTLTVGWDDEVVFTNTTDTPTILAISRLKVSTVLAPGASLRQPFSGVRGTYVIRTRAGDLRSAGTVRLEISGTVQLAAKPLPVPFGRKVDITGSSPFPGAPVDLMLNRTNSNEWTKLVTLTADANGAFAGRFNLSTGGRLQASVADGQLKSSSVIVRVLPHLTVSAKPRRVKAGSFVRIRGVFHPKGSALKALLEVYDKSKRRWQTAQTRMVSDAGVVAFAHRAVKGPATVRIRVANSSRAPGYVAVTSKPVTFVGV